MQNALLLPSERVDLDRRAATTAPGPDFHDILFARDLIR